MEALPNNLQIIQRTVATTGVTQVDNFVSSKEQESNKEADIFFLYLFVQTDFFTCPLNYLVRKPHYVYGMYSHLHIIP